MRNPSTATRRAETQYETSSVYIVRPGPVNAQDLKSLPSLSNAIEFLERIERSHPIIQRIAIRLYASFTGIDQRHLHHIANIRVELAGGVR